MSESEYRGEERRIPDNQRRRTAGRRKDDKIHPWRWRLLSAWIVIFTLVTIAAFRDSDEAAKDARKATAANRLLLEKIQTSRAESCTRTYTVIQGILNISAEGRTLDPTSKQRLERMKELADPSKCEEQTGIGG